MKKIVLLEIACCVVIAVIATALTQVLASDGEALQNAVTVDITSEQVAGFSAMTIKDATIDDEGEAYSGERYLSLTGAVTHPEWYEGDKLIKADDTYYLIKAKVIPDYYNTGSSDFSDHIDIGNSESEEKNGFAYVCGSESKTRAVGDNTYTYRTLDKNGAMLINLKCDPEKTNYLTVRLWGGDAGNTILWVCDPISGNMNKDDSKQPKRNAGIDRRDWVELNYTSQTPQFDGGFIYSTYIIPRIYTAGKDSVSLRIYSTGGPSNYSKPSIKDQTEPSRGIYDVYMTQTAAFSPLRFGASDGTGDNKIGNIYSINNESDMQAQKSALRSAVISGIAQLRAWQIYNSDNAPSYMNGMITRTHTWKSKSSADTDWKDAYYNSGRMLTQNLTPLNMLELAAYGYNHAELLELSEADRIELLDRVVAGIDFLCRAQGSNGGFYSYANTWIGGPDRREASGNNLTGFGLRSAAQAVLDVCDSLADPVLDEMIDSDADGVTDISRRAGWISMMTSARDYLITLEGGYGHAPNQDMANSIAALRFDAAVVKLGGTQLSRANRGKVFARCFGDENNLVTSCKWISPKGTILENFGAIHGGYSGDYGAAAIVELSQLTEIGSEYFRYDYKKYMARVYSVIDMYYFEGKKRVNGEDVPQEYTEGIISNRNAYYPGTERYPIDIYSAVSLKNNTALKIIANYLEQQDISKKLIAGGELTPSNAHYEDNILDAAYLYMDFDELIKETRERDIDSYEFAMEDCSKRSFAWADEMARNIVIKDDGEHIYMALNWRAPAYSTTIYNSVYEKDRQSVKANDLCRFHVTGADFDRYGYADMTTDGYKDWTAISGTDGYMQALMTCKYGSYTVIMNSHSGKSYSASELEAAAELDRSFRYIDLISGTVYEYTNGIWHSGGGQMTLDASSTLVLKPVNAVVAAEPVITDGAVSTTVTNNSDSDVNVVLYAAEYTDGALKNIKMKRISALPGETEIAFDMPNVSRVFIWDVGMKPLERK